MDLKSDGSGQVGQVVSKKPSRDMYIAEAKQGNEKAIGVIFNRYASVIRSEGSHYYIYGGGSEDIVQEGYIGLYRAIEDYKYDKRASFRTFATLCIKRQIINSVKAASRRKHGPLNYSISIDSNEIEDIGCSFIDRLQYKNSQVFHSDNNPENILIRKERISELSRIMSSCLTDLEIEILRMYINGKTYGEIATSIDKDKKSVDNTLRRVKKKAKRYLELYY